MKDIKYNSSIDYKEYGNLQEKIKTLSKEKNKAYGCHSLIKFGGKGLLIRVSDKIDRIFNMIEEDIPENDESIEDSLMDIINYCYYMILLRKGRLIKNELKE